MQESITSYSPMDGSVVAHRSIASAETITQSLILARVAQAEWSQCPIAERAIVCSAIVDAMLSMKEEIIPELTQQNGPPNSLWSGRIGRV